MTTQYADEHVAYSVAITGGTAVSATWTISPTGPIISGQTLVANVATAIISHLTPTVVYEIHYHVVMADTQERDSRLTVRGS